VFGITGFILQAVLQLEQTSAVDELLAAYSAGGLAAPLQALVSSHLLLKKANRSFVAALDDCAADDMLAHTTPLTSRDSVLSAIFGANYTPEAPAAAPSCSDLPKPLFDFLGHGLEGLKWKRLLPGMKEAIISTYEAGEVSFLWVKAGGSMPVHSHEGSEYTLVLKGSFHDNTGHYGVGDIAIADSCVNHRPLISRDEDCLCFSVTDAPLRLTGPFGKLLNSFMQKR
jgi:putative transcriptional regulator